ncbi:MAG TPA: Crp/Fnr family transcriptional regulator [Bryobacteraceae bacterium]|nr:Crp/Fnr family transcriptional regulator [Bryobacteraceae bacterium]
MSPSFAASLRRVPLFANLSLDQLDVLAQHVVARNYQQGAVVFSEGEAGGDLLIVHSGQVRILRTAATGRQQLLSIEREGSSLGEVSVFDRGPYSATAIALTPLTLLRLDGSLFRNYCVQHPEVALQVIGVLGHRLRRLRGLVEQLTFQSVRGRLIAYLLELAREQPAGATLRLAENNEELAVRLGTVRELVSRNLGRLHGEGLIRMQRRAVTIPDLDALRTELEK